MKRSARYSARASDDLVGIYHYLYQNANEAVAERFFDAAERSVNRLIKYPGVGRKRDELSPGLRAFSVHGFRDVLIFYRENPRGVFVERVIHGAQDLPELFESD